MTFLYESTNLDDSNPGSGDWNNPCWLCSLEDWHLYTLEILLAQSGRSRLSRAAD